MEAYTPAARPAVPAQEVVLDTDFVALHEAAKDIVRQLRRDEQAPELVLQINPGGADRGDGAHNYFHEPYRRARSA